MGPQFKSNSAAFEKEFRECINQDKIDWEQFWILSRRIEQSVATRLIESNLIRVKGSPLRAKNEKADFLSLDQLLLPGEITRKSVDKARKLFTIDMEFHREDVDLLKYFGAADRPIRANRSHLSHFFIDFGKSIPNYHEPYEEHLEWARQQFRKPHIKPKPDAKYLDFVGNTYCAPLTPLVHFTGEAGVLMTSEAVQYAVMEPIWTMIWTNKSYASIARMTTTHTEKEVYPPKEFVSGIVWALKKYGWLNTSLGPNKCNDAVGPSLCEWSQFLPVAECSEEEANLLALPNSIDNLTESHFKNAIKRSLEFEGNMNDLSSFYALIAARIPPPEKIRCRRDSTWVNAKPNFVLIEEGCDVAEHAKQYRLHSNTREEFRILASQWGLLTSAPRPFDFIPTGEPERAIDRFSMLESCRAIVEEFQLQQCESLWYESRDEQVGESREEIRTLLRNDCLYYCEELTDESLLEQLLENLGPQITPDEKASILKQIDLREISVKRREVCEIDSIEEKLVEAIGVTALRAGIPTTLLKWYESSHSSLGSTDVARLALACHDVEVLKEYRHDLGHNGFQPPTRWDGGESAIAFVRELGFPESYAGFQASARSVWEDVSGPVNLPDLHEYQETVVRNITDMLEETSPGRGLLSLPTGAGKTRVAVESIIRWLKRHDRDITLVWIAQNDELCEQAVECWSQAWRAIGPIDRPVRINRLWGRTNERVRPPLNGSSVIIATFQSLRQRIERTDFEWVFTPDVVLIDEAHGAIAKSYTEILRRMGLDHRKTERPLIGLTATPFRGSEDVEETRRLVLRFGKRRFDSQDLSFRDFQSMGVLAQVTQEPLEGDELVLSSTELAQLRKSPNWLPASVETRLGKSEPRNVRIIDHIRERVKNGPILVFATSVEQSEQLAVRLSMDGITASSITGQTSPSRRRCAVSRFKSGELKVLTNYGVLTTGFDAPAVAVVYVTRPVYSRVLYQQMIGRGLRGPKNGGKENCLIVNVADNIRQYGEELAFRHFEHLWTHPVN